MIGGPTHGFAVGLIPDGMQLPLLTLAVVPQDEDVASVIANEPRTQCEWQSAAELFLGCVHGTITRR